MSLRWLFSDPLQTFSAALAPPAIGATRPAAQTAETGTAPGLRRARPGPTAQKIARFVAFRQRIPPGRAGPLPRARKPNFDSQHERDAFHDQYRRQRPLEPSKRSVAICSACTAKANANLPLNKPTPK